MAAATFLVGCAYGSDYLTEGYDPGRTGWIKDEKLLTKGSLDRVGSRRT